MKYNLNRSPLVGKQHEASPKRKAEPFPKVTAGVDPSSTPPRSKRPVRENDITPGRHVVNVFTAQL